MKTDKHKQKITNKVKFTPNWQVSHNEELYPVGRLCIELGPSTLVLYGTGSEIDHWSLPSNVERIVHLYEAGLLTDDVPGGSVVQYVSLTKLINAACRILDLHYCKGLQVDGI